MKQLFTLSRQLHKWLALIVATQMLIWAVTGVLFGFVDGSNSSGAVYRDKEAENVLFKYPNNAPDMDMQKMLLEHQQNFPKASIKKIELAAYNQQWFYSIISAESSASNNHQQLFDRNFNVYYFTELQAQKIALLGYTGSGSIIDSGRYNKDWRFRFDDELATDIYVSAATGRVIKHYNNTSAYNDFLKLLHFMDYTNKHSFNHWWIKLFAILSFLMTLSGCYWLYQLIKLRVKRWKKA